MVPRLKLSLMNSLPLNYPPFMRNVSRAQNLGSQQGLKWTHVMAKPAPRTYHTCGKRGAITGPVTSSSRSSCTSTTTGPPLKTKQYVSTVAVGRDPRAGLGTLAAHLRMLSLSTTS